MVNEWWPVHFGHRNDGERELAAAIAEKHRARRRSTTHPDAQEGSMSETGTPYLTVPGAATYLNTSVRFVRRLIAERRIAFHKVGAHVRIAVVDLEAFVQGGRVEPITASSVLRDLQGVA